MPHLHLVRVGLMRRVGRFSSPTVRYRRGARVVCRTARGLEIGEVVSDLGDRWGDGGKRSEPQSSASLGARFTRPQPPRSVASSAPESDGALVRAMTVEDELLLARIEKNKEKGFDAVSQTLNERGVSTPLLDIEHLMDGRSLYFYFLGEVTPQIEAILDELTEVYESQVQFRRFAETLTAGCGPDCGTEAGGGCSSGGCSTCAVAKACNTGVVGQ